MLKIDFTFSNHVTNKAYVLDLRIKFPRAYETLPGDLLWRERVVGLERDLANLQTKYDQDHTSTLTNCLWEDLCELRSWAEFLTLQASEARAVASSPVALPAPIKKKTKKKSPKHPDTVSSVDLEAVLNGLHHRKSHNRCSSST